MAILGNILDIMTGITAIIAAVFWFKSAKIETPESFVIHVVKPDRNPMGGNPMGGTYMGHAYSENLVKLAEALKKQSKLSAIAAGFAASSAIILSISIIVKLVYSNQC